MNGHGHWASDRAAEDFVQPPTPDIAECPRRVVIFETHPAIGAALEHLMLREGYVVELVEKRSAVTPGPALLLAGSGDYSGLYVVKARDVTATLYELFDGESMENSKARSEGVSAFLPIPFGSEDVLRVVRAVSGFRVRAVPNRKKRK